MSKMIAALALAGFACLGCHGEVSPTTILQQNRDAMYALTAYHAECRTVLTFDASPNQEHHLAPPHNQNYEYAVLTAEKPAKMRYDQWFGESEIKKAPTSPADVIYVSDGVKEFRQYGDHYREQSGGNSNRLSTNLEPWEGFFNPKSSVDELISADDQEEAPEITDGGTAVVDGVACDKVLIHRKVIYEGREMEFRSTYFFGKQDHLARRLIEHMNIGKNPGFTRDAIVTGIDTHRKSPAALFTYSPAKGVTKEETAETKPLLAAGTKAPDFTAKDANGATVEKLSDLKGKVVVLDFWASWCGPCKDSMAGNQKVMAKLAAAGRSVVLLGVDDGEEFASFKGWVEENSAKLQSLRFAFAEKVSGELYNVSSIPTQYVIDKDGIIRASLNGYDGSTDALEDAIEAAGG